MRPTEESLAIPMFPLGTVLLPSMLLPLRVFEDRYLRMLDDMSAQRRSELGVVLIERGSEVGGGDVRCEVGCTARILDVRRWPDGSCLLDCVGERRIAVTGWLDDDPYPRAMVRDLPDVVVGASGGATFDDVERLLHRVAALASELGAPGLPQELDLDDDPVRRSYQIGVLAPVGALDRQRVLTAPGPTDRLDLLAELLAEQIELLNARLSLGRG